MTSLDTRIDAVPIAVDAAEIDALPLEEVGGHRWRTVWRSETCIAGVLDLIAGERLPDHAHHDAEHHVWVARGECEAAGRCLVAGSYLRVPPGVPHALEAGPRGCRLFFVYHRTPVTP